MKARAENFKLKQQIQELQKLQSLEGQSQNNTSSTSLLPSEFKETWKQLVTEKIIDAFSNFYDKPYIFVLLTQSTFKI